MDLHPQSILGQLATNGRPSETAKTAIAADCRSNGTFTSKPIEPSVRRCVLPTFFLPIVTRY